MAEIKYQVREHNRTIKGAPGHPDHPDYYVFCSPVFTDYQEALRYAIDYEKSGKYRCWVDCVSTYKYSNAGL